MRTIYLFAFLVFTMAVVFLVGCGGGDSQPYSQTITNPGNGSSFALSGGGSVTANVDGVATYTVTVTPISGAGSVSLTTNGLPEGAQAVFAQNPVNLHAEPVDDALTVTVPTSVADGSYPFTITGSRGSETHTLASATLVVDATGGLVVQVSTGGTQTTEPDSSAIFPLTAKLGQPPIQNGKGALHEVTFSVTGLPDGTSSRFTQNPITATKTGVTTELRVDVDNNFPPGTNARRSARSKRQDLSFPFTIVATVDGKTFNLPAILVVQVDNPAFDFAINGPQRVVVFTYNPDQDAFEGNVGLVSGAASPVYLTATCLPQGVSATFGPSRVTPSDPGTPFEVLFDVAGNAITGTYPCSVVGIGGGVTRQHDFSLVIYAPDTL
ncbi:hypothetical protein BH11ARM2_BH11ARM2_09600 [soil metagenome]